MLSAQMVIARNQVQQHGQGQPTLLLAHGFGCDQQMWRRLLPLLQSEYRVLTFNYVGSGAGNMSAYQPERYQTLDGYAQDIVEICQALDLTDLVVVGHSVSAMIGLLAAQLEPARIRSLVMVCPSPCFLNMPPDYFGGFELSDLQELIDLMDKNYIGWAEFLSPLVSGLAADDTLSRELTQSFCSTNPVSAKNFAKATFFSDHRDLLPACQLPVLILQSELDALAAPAIGQYMQAKLPKGVLNLIAAKGHCLHMTHPQEVATAMQRFIRSGGLSDDAS